MHSTFRESVSMKSLSTTTLTMTNITCTDAQVTNRSTFTTIAPFISLVVSLQVLTVAVTWMTW